MGISNGSICVECGGTLKYYDYVKRIVRTKGGDSWRVKIKRFKCEGCKRIRRMLPNYIFPYKHYEADIIQGVLAGTITPDTLGYEDYPCEMTFKRWIGEK